MSLYRETENIELDPEVMGNREGFFRGVVMTHFLWKDHTSGSVDKGIIHPTHRRVVRPSQPQARHLLWPAEAGSWRAMPQAINPSTHQQITGPTCGAAGEMAEEWAADLILLQENVKLRGEQLPGHPQRDTMQSAFRGCSL